MYDSRPEDLSVEHSAVPKAEKLPNKMMGTLHAQKDTGSSSWPISVSFSFFKICFVFIMLLKMKYKFDVKIIDVEDWDFHHLSVYLSVTALNFIFPFVSFITFFLFHCYIFMLATHINSNRCRANNS